MVYLKFLEEALGILILFVKFSACDKKWGASTVSNVKGQIMEHSHFAYTSMISGLRKPYDVFIILLSF